MEDGVKDAEQRLGMLRSNLQGYTHRRRESTMLQWQNART